MKSLHRKSVIVLLAVLLCLQFILRAQPRLCQIQSTPSDEPVAPPLQSNKKKIASFIRIPKTGSTSLLKFLDHYSGMRTYDTFLPSAALSQLDHNVINCFYGKQDSPMLSSNETNKPSCGHVTYKDLTMTWNETKAFTKAKLHIFTIIREPFAALQSLFYYMHHFVNTTRWCSECGSKPQYDQVVAGDFEAWMTLLYHETNAPPFQYQFLDRNVTKAIEMVQGKSPQVTVYLNECFEASLRIMDKQYAFPSGAVDAFVNSANFKSNVGQKEKESETRLRDLAKQWFIEEYKFYDAAVTQFQRQLWSSGLDPSRLRNRCVL